MKKGQLRRLMREKRRALRQRLPLLKRQARERMDQIPAVRAERRRRRIRRIVGSGVIAALLLLIRCDCGVEPALPVPIEVAAPPVIKPKVADAGVPKPRPLKASTDPQPRPNYDGDARPPPRWIDEFRLAVASRSPRLSECFNGTERPGALRWTASVNPESGAVSDHELEPVGGRSEFTAWLGTAQRECVVKVLSNPPYKLTVPKAEALPDRVSLVIEF